MLMGSQDEEDTKTVAEPGEGMEEIDPSGRILSDEEVEESERDGVTREHVVPTSPYTLETKSGTRPYYVGVVQTVGPGPIWSGPLSIKIE